LGKTTYAFLEVTDAGWQLLGQRKPARYIGHGSFVHTVLIRRVARYLGTRHWDNVQLEFPIGPTRHAVDLYARSPASVPTAIEITLSTSNVVSNALQTLTPPSVVRDLIFLCPFQNDCTKVESLLRQDSATALYLGQVQFRRIDEFMS
jgi:hypothetical protein